MGDKVTERKISFQDDESTIGADEEEDIETQIEINIDSIENILRNDNFLIKFVIKHEEATLGESRLIKLNSSYESLAKVHPIGFKVSLPYSASDTTTVHPLISSPVLIHLYEVPEEDNASNGSSALKKKEKNPSKSKRASKVEKPEIREVKLLGMCNVDLLPIILGEKTFNEKLVVEIPSYTWDGSAVSWANLPRISVSLSRDEPKVISESAEFNIMNVTVESIYNLPPYFNDCMDYKCATVVNTDVPMNESLIVFESGKLTEFHDVEKKKAWRPLQKLESRAKFSKYAIGCDYDVVKNDFKKEFDLRDTVKKNLPRIEWNSMQRVLLEKNDIENIYDRLKGHKFWPFEIMLSEKTDEPKENGIEDSSSIVYQCYVDTSQLLFPGRTKCRVLAQLYTQSSSELEEKTGLGVSIFNVALSEETKDTKSVNADSDSIEFYRNLEESSTPSYPLFTDDGKPTVVLIEFELYRPFIVARVLEDYTEAIEILKAKPKSKEPIYAYTPDLVHEQYIGCIRHLTDVLTESYRDFMERCACEVNEELAERDNEKCEDEIRDPCRAELESRSPRADDVTCPYFYIPDELSKFEQYLHETGKYVSIRSTLKSRIINLLDQKFVLDSPEWCSNENQNFVASCYTYLTEQMHVALNTKLDVRLDAEQPELESAEDLWFRSEEAYELEDYDRADRLLTKIIANNRNDPDSWILYAIHFVKSCDTCGAIECCRRAIELDSRHKIALTFYGILLVAKQEYADAEIFLKAVVHFYPRFAEGWAILHLFYIKIQYYPGIDLTLEIAEKCLKDRVRDTDTMHILSKEPLAWSTVLCNSARIFAVTAVLLLKLNLYNFAGLALAQELCHGERSVELLYFLSVNYYLQGEYATALKTLDEAERIIGLEYSVAALTGHSHYKLGNIGAAIGQYEAVDMMYDRPEDIHMVHLRMGFYYVDIKEYVHARNVFLRACKLLPSCKTWLGVGISGYHLEQFDESEITLMEANRIDNEDAEVWAYLCLLSMALHRQEEFAQCYRQTVKNNLRCDKIWQIIKRSMDTLGYSSPIAVIGNINERCTC